MRFLVSKVLLSGLAGLFALVATDKTSKPYELLYIWEAFKLDQSAGSSQRWILKSWQQSNYDFDGFIKKICTKTDYKAGTVTNTDDLAGSIKQWQAGNF